MGWNAAVVARHYMDGFESRLKSAVQVSEAFYTALARHPRVKVERIPNGTNLTRVTFTGRDAKTVAARLGERGVRLPASAGQTVTLAVNETWARTTAESLAGAFEHALA